MLRYTYSCIVSKHNIDGKNCDLLFICSKSNEMASIFKRHLTMDAYGQVFLLSSLTIAAKKFLPTIRAIVTTGSYSLLQTVYIKQFPKQAEMTAEMTLSCVHRIFSLSVQTLNTGYKHPVFCTRPYLQ